MPPLCKGRCHEGAEGLSVGTSIARPGIDALMSVIPRSRERADEESPGRTSFAVILTLRVS